MDDLYINKKCYLFEAAVVASCDVAFLLPAADKEGKERREAALQAMAFLTSNTQNPNGIPETSL